MKDDESESTLWDNQFKEDVKSGRFFWLTNKHVMDFERGHFKDFWMLYEKLSNDTKKLADEAFALLKENPKAIEICATINHSNDSPKQKNKYEINKPIALKRSAITRPNLSEIQPLGTSKITTQM